MFVGGSESQGILYVALNAANQIAALSISGSGALTPLPGSPVAAGRGPEALLGSFNFLDAVNILTTPFPLTAWTRLPAPSQKFRVLLTQ
jgi:hypothetical protein